MGTILGTFELSPNSGILECFLMIGDSVFVGALRSFGKQNNTARRTYRRAATVQISQSSGSGLGHLSNPCLRGSFPNPAGVLHPFGLSRFHIRPTFGFQLLEIGGIFGVFA